MDQKSKGEGNKLLARSPGLKRFFLWPYLSKRDYSTLLENIEDLKNIIKV